MRLLPFLLVSCAIAQPPSPSWQKEVALGRAMAADFEKQYPRLDNAALSDYVNGVADRVGRATPRNVRVADSPETRLAVLPGGRLYLTTGLIARAASEAELAGVFAHAIAHVALGCPSASRWMSAAGGCCARWDNLLPRSLTDSVRERESEADRLAVVWLSDAGYDPLGLLEFMSKWRHDRPEVAPFVSSDDLLALRQQVEESKLKNPLVVTTSAFDGVRSRFAPAPPSLFRRP